MFFFVIIIIRKTSIFAFLFSYINLPKMYVRRTPLSCDQCVYIQCSQYGLVCVCFVFGFFFFPVFFTVAVVTLLCSPLAGSVWAVQLRSSAHVAAWKRAGTCSIRLSPAFRPRLFSPPFPRVLSHTWTNRSTSRWPRSHFSFLTCIATARALRALFPPFSPLLPLCLFMLLLLLLPDIFRDELQSTAGGKKNVGGAVSATCVPLLSFSLSRGPLLFPYRTSSFSLTSPALFHSLYICPCPPIISIPLFSALLFFIFFCLKFIM